MNESNNDSINKTGLHKILNDVVSVGCNELERYNFKLYNNVVCKRYGIKPDEMNINHKIERNKEKYFISLTIRLAKDFSKVLIKNI